MAIINILRYYSVSVILILPQASWLYSPPFRDDFVPEIPNLTGPCGPGQAKATCFVALDIGGSSILVSATCTGCPRIIETSFLKGWFAKL